MLSELNKIKAIIFDMDGVLLLSNKCHEIAFKKVLADIGIKNFSYSSVAGMSTIETFKKILSNNNKFINNDELEILCKKKSALSLKLLSKVGKIADGSARLISKLKNKYRLALATSASQKTVEFFLKKSKYARAFEFYLYGSLVKKAKPDPEIYELATKKLKLSPDECIVIEDSLNGIKSAKKAKIFVIAISKNSLINKLASLKPDVIVSKLIDVEPILL